MDILGTPDIGPLLLVGLSLASFVTAFIGVFTGTAGGVILLAIMAMVMPPTAVIPVHTVVMLGTGLSRTVIMWRFVMRGTLLPFIGGAVVGAAAGAKVFVALPNHKRNKAKIRAHLIEINRIENESDALFRTALSRRRR